MFCSLFIILSSYVFAKELTGVKIRFNDTQLEITTNKTLNSIRLRLNGDYTCQVERLPAGVYTLGLATFTDSKGNRFNPFRQKVIRITIFCDEGSTGFTAN